jgi:hypothetical protein
MIRKIIVFSGVVLLPLFMMGQSDSLTIMKKSEYTNNKLMTEFSLGYQHFPLTYNRSKISVSLLNNFNLSYKIIYRNLIYRSGFNTTTPFNTINSETEINLGVQKKIFSKNKMLFYGASDMVFFYGKSAKITTTKIGIGPLIIIQYYITSRLSFLSETGGYIGFARFHKPYFENTQIIENKLGIGFHRFLSISVACTI